MQNPLSEKRKGETECRFKRPKNEVKDSILLKIRSEMLLNFQSRKPKV